VKIRVNPWPSPFRSERSARSVNVGLRQLEGVLDQFDVRLGVLGEDDFDDVEPEKNLGIIEQAQPGERAARDAIALLGPDGFEGPAEFFAAARFHFHKNQGVAVATDDVDLAAGAPFEIAIENLVAVVSEKTRGQFFALCAASQMTGRFARPPDFSKESRNAGMEGWRFQNRKDRQD
jgi:hypothetical protein